MKRRDFLKLGAKAAVGLPVIATFPVLAKPVVGVDLGEPSTTVIAEGDPFETIAWKSWHEGRILNDGWYQAQSPIDENLMKKLGENAAKTVNQIQHDIKTKAFS